MAEGVMAKEKRRFQTVRRKTWLSAVLIITFRRLGNEIEGNIYNMHIPEAIPFRGMGDMIVKMERIYDLLGYPQAEFRIRHRDDEGKWDGTLLENDALWNYDKTVQGDYEAIATVSRSVMYVETRFRRNKSWQGILQIGGKKATYGSVLEFIHCVVNALDGQ